MTLSIKFNPKSNIKHIKASFWLCFSTQFIFLGPFLTKLRKPYVQPDFKRKLPVNALPPSTKAWQNGLLLSWIFAQYQQMDTDAMSILRSDRQRQPGHSFPLL